MPAFAQQREPSALVVVEGCVDLEEVDVQLHAQLVVVGHVDLLAFTPLLPIGTSVAFPQVASQRPAVLTRTA
jgi:hypothetical protein